MKATELKFHELAAKLKPNHFRGTLVCFDPGETTGLAIFKDSRLKETSQLITKDLFEGSRVVDDLFETVISADPPLPPLQHHNVRVVMEDYRVYGWKTDQHAWAALHTPKFIGCIVALCYKHQIPPPAMQMAQLAKGFCTDEKLEAWGYYDRGMRHARDAVRHGCYYTLFDKETHDQILPRDDPQ